MGSGTTIQLGRGTRVALLVLWLVLCAALLEAAARVGWRVGRDVSLREPGLILYAYYPEMWHVLTERPTEDDGVFDILFLGGSVLDPDWGSIEQQLLEQLAIAGHHAVRISNQGIPAHTTRDSLLKYRALAVHDFDLVFLYHGINETRTNNAPPEVFRDDYSHYAWYEELNALAPYHRRASFSLPYTLRYLWVRARQAAHPDRYIVEHVPREEWTQYGGDVRSARAFEKNVQAIIDEASERGERLMLATFAHHVPDDYSLARFEARELDYLLHLTALEIWGRPEFVLKGIRAHNEVIRRLARTNDVWFVDQERFLRGSAANFNDAVHLTTQGSRRFVDNLIAGLPDDLLAGHEARAGAAD